MIPAWLRILSIISLSVAGLCGLIIVGDEIRHPQKMWIMNLVWPITALYFGLIGLWAYYAIGRKSTSEHKGHEQVEPKDQKPFWQIVAVAATHCGGGCTLGDIIAEWTIFYTAWTIAGAAIWPEYILDFTLAYLLGIVFQFFAIAPMRNLSVGPGIWAAIKADTLSLAAFEIGLFGWMALAYWVFFTHPHLRPTEPTYWLMMQIGMALGFLANYPVNIWLINAGVKEAMWRKNHLASHEKAAENDSVPHRILLLLLDHQRIHVGSELILT